MNERINEREFYRPRDARHRVGDRIAFKPFAFVTMEHEEVPIVLSGTVIYVNEAHRYYTAEAPCNGYVIREAFKF